MMTNAISNESDTTRTVVESTNHNTFPPMMMKLRALVTLLICSGQSSVTRAEAQVCSNPESCGEPSAPPKKKRKQKVKTILERLGEDVPTQGRSAPKLKQQSPPENKRENKKKLSQPSEDEDFMQRLQNEVEVVPSSELFKSLSDYQVYPTGTGACMTGE